MKKLLFVFSMVVASAVAANAQTDTTSAAGQGSSSQYQTQQDDYTDKESIPATELPSIVQEQLNGTDYSGWAVGNAYRKEKDGQTFYAVELSKDGEKKMVKFDAQGNKVKEKDKSDKK